MKLCIIADIHIKLGQKNVPVAWQRNRFRLLARELGELDFDVLVIAGDLLDTAKPTVDEIGLMFDFLHSVCGKKILIPGNHEMVDKVTDCYESLTTMLEATNTEVIRTFETRYGVDFIPYNIIKESKWPTPNSRVAVTHVRGEIPPHVKPEIDLDRFSAYEKVFAGDLHSFTNSQANLLYPGSPFTTSFHRNELSGSNGVFIFDTDTGNHEWIELRLPQLIKKLITNKADIVATDYHHTVYELEGGLAELKATESSELLAKKITKNVSSPPTLQLGGSLVDELREYLTVVKGIEEPEVYLDTFNEVMPTCK